MITKDMTIGEVVQNYPSSAEILMAEGVHCVGCGAAYWETIEQGLAGHGLSEEDVTAVIKKLNDAIPKEEGSQESLIITEHAAAKVHDLLKRLNKEGMAIRIGVKKGGCSGHQYLFDFEQDPKEDDEIFTVAGVRFFIKKESLELIRGSRIDYVEALQGGGFKVTNPNAKKTCGCGESFS